MELQDGSLIRIKMSFRRQCSSYEISWLHSFETRHSRGRYLSDKVTLPDKTKEILGSRAKEGFSLTDLSALNICIENLWWCCNNDNFTEWVLRARQGTKQCILYAYLHLNLGTALWDDDGTCRPIYRWRKWGLDKLKAPQITQLVSKTQAARLQSLA